MTRLPPISLHHRETTLSWRFPEHIAPWTLRGTSRSAHATAWFIPELGVAIDGGAVVYTSRPDHIFITHTHADHIFQLPSLRSRRKPPQLFVPVHATALVERYLSAAQALTTSVVLPEDHQWTRSYDLIGVSPGDRYSISRDRFVVDVLRCDHSVPCVGYLISSRKQKLKTAFSELTGPQIGALRKEGVEVTQEQITPIVGFLGDTTPAVYDTHPELLQAKVVVGECTFLHPEHIGNATRTRHTHFEQLLPIIEANPQTLFVLTHFSLRYQNQEVIDFFASRNLPNALPWLAAGDVR